METLETSKQKNPIVTTIIVYVITVLFAIGMVLVWCGTHKLLTEKLDLNTTLKELCNAFTISGALVLCFGGLVWVSDKGAFDGFAFSMKTFLSVHFFMFNKHPEHDKETYADYVERKHKSNGKKKAYAFQIILGAALLLIALVFFIVYKTTMVE